MPDAPRLLPLPSQVYHLVEEPNWPSVQRHGLLSARELMRLAGLSPTARRRLSHAQRRALTPLADQVTIRDQLPMPAGALQRCLVGMTPAQWYDLLNGMVFFWCDRARMERMLGACGGRPQVLLTLDTAALLARHAAAAFVTPFNTGNARRRPAVRGRATFVPLATWLASGWRAEAEALPVRERSRRHAPVELTVAGAVRDAGEFIVGVEHIE